MARNAEVDRLLDELIKNCDGPDDLLGEKGLLKQLTAGLVERMLESEITDHLGYEKHDSDGKNSGNSRNGKTPKTLKTDRGAIPIEVPRDRNGEFEPQIVRKRQRRFDRFDDTIISLYSRGMTTRAIQEHLKELYGVDVSPSLLSSVTDDVIEEVKAWQSRPLDTIYPIVYLDAIRVKIRDDGSVTNKAVYLALGVNLSGNKELLGLWTAQNEGAKFWMSVRGAGGMFVRGAWKAEVIQRWSRCAGLSTHRVLCSLFSLSSSGQRSNPAWRIFRASSVLPRRSRSRRNSA